MFHLECDPFIPPLEILLVFLVDALVILRWFCSYLGYSCLHYFIFLYIFKGIMGNTLSKHTKCLVNV